MASLYLHIPFCERKCIYCDFYSVESRSAMEAFLAALPREIGLYAAQGERTTFDTVFFGGGTPSLLPPARLESILRTLHRNFHVDARAEVTIEANPGTVTGDTLRAYRSLGVNRLSIGIQSFDERALSFLGRIHDAEQAEISVRMARAAGFDNVSVDLIYALPGQGEEEWRRTLAKAVALEPDHISAYSLIVEDHTPLQRMVQSRLVSPVPEEIEAGLFEHTMSFLEEHEFEHYEVSNYARPGFQCRHNVAYWTHRNYLAFGPSAHAFWRAPDGRSARRWANIANIGSYCSQLGAGRLPLAMEERLGVPELVRERIFLSLRNGFLDLPQLSDEFGIRLTQRQKDLAQALQREELARDSGGRLVLTRKGYLLCDEIAERMIDLQ